MNNIMSLNNNAIIARGWRHHRWQRRHRNAAISYRRINVNELRWRRADGIGVVCAASANHQAWPASHQFTGSAWRSNLLNRCYRYKQ